MVIARRLCPIFKPDSRLRAVVDILLGAIGGSPRRIQTIRTRCRLRQVRAAARDVDGVFKSCPILSFGLHFQATLSIIHYVFAALYFSTRKIKGVASQVGFCSRQLIPPCLVCNTSRGTSLFARPADLWPAPMATLSRCGHVASPLR